MFRCGKCIYLSFETRKSIAMQPAMLRERLFGLADTAYRDFMRPLVPGIGPLIGVRVPELRRLARELARGDWHDYLAGASDHYFEERLLQGLVIGCARCMPEERLALTERYLALVDNWALCDLFCRRLPSAEREPMWHFIGPLFCSDREYVARFAAVMGRGNFVDDVHLAALLDLLDSCRHEGYYARMGVAWALSDCYVKYPGPTEEFLRRATLDPRTHNLALRKIAESRRVAPETRIRLRALRR